VRHDEQGPWDQLTNAQRRAFERIAAGAPPKCSARTLDSLVRAGLVERHKVSLAPADRFGPIYQYAYSVPIAAHMSWCEWFTRPDRRRRRKSLPPQLPIDDLPLFSGRREGQAA
jgi:hypothetical protein